MISFIVPTPAEQSAALGSTAALPELLRRALEPGPEFQALPAPGPDDWLANHAEAGQTFEQFQRARPNKPERQRNKIYLQPLGEFNRAEAPALDHLRAYAAAFFQMDVQALPGVGSSAFSFTTRTNPATQQRQLLTGDILAVLKQRLPADAFCLLAVTMEDLYPEPSWNFVFGQASLRERVGVYSFARYTRTFDAQTRDKDYKSLLLRRSCKVLTHETAHMFGLEHCIYFACILNGSNHLQESDRRPMHLCPVCLRKLQASIGFEAIKRYEALLQFDRTVGFQDEAEWLEHRLQKVNP